LYFLFTYEGSNHAFIITPLQLPQWYEEKEIFYNNVGGMFLFINEGQEREMTIILKGNQNQNTADVNHVNFKLKYNSWDNIEIL
jgi:hypothetical protein